MAAITTSGGGRSWQRIVDPPTGHIATKTSWSGTDSFTTSGSYLEVDYSNVVPAGTVAVSCVLAYVDYSATNSILYYRPYGDSNISNTPHASSEYSHRVSSVTNGRCEVQAVLYLSSDYKVRFTVNSASAYIYVAYPMAVLL